MELFPPVFAKHPGVAIPEAPRVYYLLAAEGLYLCRRSELATSAVRARAQPPALEPHAESLAIHVPPFPPGFFERVVGFFGRVAQVHDAEAVLLLFWNRRLGRWEIEVPPQTTLLRIGWRGRRHPLGVRYELPPPVTPDRVLAGDAHSHVDGPAYASATDVADEHRGCGLHLVVGRLGQDPPDVRAEWVVDGCRFEVPVDRFVPDYRGRDPDVPSEWLDRVQVEVRADASPPSPRPRMTVP